MAAAVLLLGGGIFFGVNAYVTTITSDARAFTVANAPHRPVALVFGAGLEPDGKPSGMLAERLDASIALYRAKRVAKLLFSGDNGSVYHNELAAMQRYALARHVPQNVISLDYAGFNTYASCYRAKAIFGVRSAILVTQKYHLPRAVYICSHLGIDAIGVGTPDWGHEPNTMMMRFVFREYLATMRASWDLNVAHPKPKYLGPFVGLR